MIVIVYFLFRVFFFCIKNVLRQVCQNRGAGNNWAHGYLGYGDALGDAILETVQAEVEECDTFGGFLVCAEIFSRVHSLNRQRFP
jgi:hypothetical protein